MPIKNLALVLSWVKSVLGCEMLQALSIENVVLIKRLDLVFNAGLTVLTGETGAGKSILLDALYLALGERADTHLIRLGEKEAIVTACFSFSGENFSSTFLEPFGIIGDEPLLILRRHILREGPSRAFINDKPVTLSTLKAVAAELLDIHGQFDCLLEPQSYRALLDDYGNHSSFLQKLESHFLAWQQAENELAEARSTATQKTQRLAFLTMALEDLGQLAYEEGEETTLQQDRLTASHFTKLQEFARLVYDRLYGPRGAEALVAEALVSLDKTHQLSEGLFASLATFLERCHVELQEHTSSLKDFCEADKAYDLEAIDQRLYDLKSMARKYGVEVTNLASIYQSFIREKEKLLELTMSMEALEVNVASLKEAYKEVAHELGERRRQVAYHLEDALKQEFASLKLASAVVTFDFSPLPVSQWNQLGTERILLLVKMNEGSGWGSLAKIASGGERSRLMLAIKTVLNMKAEDFTQIFDEIDVGMSGAAAAAVGKALKKLSLRQQVLAITHAPQVASVADFHWRVHKQEGGGQTLTQVEVLQGPERVQEIARLLSGDIITAEAKLAASALLSPIPSSG